MSTTWFKVAAVALYAGLSVLPSSQTYAARIADIRNTKHNFSAAITPALDGGGSRVVSATTEKQICVFCHTPHAGEAGPYPLWNRKLSPNATPNTYDTYRSGSIDATGPDVALGQPTGISKLCLSCHDGTMAIGAVNVLTGAFTDRNALTADIAMTGTGAGGVMAPGEGTDTGFTRFLGIDLKNDHPISMTFNTALATKDGEMRDPATLVTNIANNVGVRKKGVRPLLPLEPQTPTATEGMVQCNTCHDPHIRDNTLGENIKFLRASRFQVTAPTATPFNKDNDIICLACHIKDGWVGSAHANSQVATGTYTAAAAAVREFPANKRVWETACLACHDTHTVQGSRRLLREGTDSTATPSPSGSLIKRGGGPAIEQTCFACHSNSGNTLTAQGDGTSVPNIMTDFTTPGTHMPITTTEQQGTTEVHNIGTGGADPEVLATTSGANKVGADFIEAKATLAMRHVECTDCHNPHRVIRNRIFNANPNTPDAGPTHRHDGTPHDNLASGVLKGAWGVEPTYGSADFNAAPVTNISFIVKRGDPGVGSATDVGQPYVTREYQICLKCHSNYAYGATPPMLRVGGPTTPPGINPSNGQSSNGMTQYTNQANEYNSPLNHVGQAVTTDSGAAPATVPLNSTNHRSWHPVRAATGRTAIPGGTNAAGGNRRADSNNWVAPFNAAVGTQTMYCTDCHGSEILQQGTSVPDGNGATTGQPLATGENGRVWGPHGSANNFLLKGQWSGDAATGTGEGQPTHLCFKCHQYDQYGNPDGLVAVQASGFALGGGGGGMGGMMGGGMMGGGGGGMCMGGGCMGAGGAGFTGQNLHIFHANVVNNFRCNLCHIAVPHGWKNKVFLNNLNDVGPEAGLAVGTEERNNTTTRYVRGPYYNGASLKVRTFAESGLWNPNYCGSSGVLGNGNFGVFWMAQSSEACLNAP